MKRKKIVGIGVFMLACILIVVGVLRIGSLKQPTENGGGDKGVECIDIKTPYATLEFPKELSENVETEVSDQTENGKYTVSFYGRLEGKGKIHLSDLIFGEEEGYTVGYLVAKEGKEKIAVNIVYHDSDNNTWTEDELIEIQEMQSGVEYVIDALVESGEMELVK